MKINKAVFLDKDGTLIPDIPYNTNPDLITLSPYAVKGLKRLMKSGYLLIVISNQPGLAFGYIRKEEIFEIEQKLNSLLNMHGIYLSGFYYCPHHPKGIIKEFSIVCDCRKPKSGLLIEAARIHNINLSDSWMIGDILDDIESGNRVGCRTLLLNNGNETIWKMNNQRTPDCIVSDINHAAEYILIHDNYERQQNRI
ncbi:HAD family hydrolase [Pedobacter lusitanus]|uniref:D,D-heptose 1,7-bisphosphate phosphatase n=1 Tax=Pedobacter lusitanus TaxID=1503925 RepID=A0A0D0GSN8_9SPHI|nr:HAD family hydrolase [Pedobacter lusitanus]KIO77466.1 HAD family hydrolase [Pedobacter lusitanus]